jgi:hypothetical protein
MFGLHFFYAMVSCTQHYFWSMYLTFSSKRIYPIIVDSLSNLITFTYYDYQAHTHNNEFLKVEFSFYVD